MENPNILVDTSIIIEHLRKTQRENTQLHELASKYRLYTSSVVEFELRAGAADDQKQQQVDVILSAFVVILPFSSEVSQEAAYIYRVLKRNNLLIEIRDIFIAATAITHNMRLATTNRKHFERIDKLQLV